MISSWRKTNYIKDPKIAKRRIVWHKDIQNRSKQSKYTVWNKQSHGPSNHMNKRYYDKSNGVFYKNYRSSP